MKIDLSKFQKIKEGSSKIHLSEGRLAIWSKGDRVRIPFSVDREGEYKVYFKVKTEADFKNPKSSAYNFYVDEKIVKTEQGQIGPLVPKVYGDNGSYWGTHIATVKLTKGAHTVDVEALHQWQGIESIDVIAEPTSIPPQEDFEKKYLEERVRADTAEVNLSKTKNDLELSKKEYEELAKEVIKLRQKVELADDLVALALPNKEQFLTHVQKSVEIIDKYKGL